MIGYGSSLVRSAGSKSTPFRKKQERGNKLRGSEYDDTTWSARSWTVYASQRLSCALMRAVAFELAHALALSSARDPRE